MKRVFSIILVSLSLLLGLTACSTPQKETDNELLGTWKNGDLNTTEVAEFTLLNDSSFTMDVAAFLSSDQYSGFYSIDEEAKVINFEFEDFLNKSDNKITLPVEYEIDSESPMTITTFVNVSEDSDAYQYRRYFDEERFVRITDDEGEIVADLEEHPDSAFSINLEDYIGEPKSDLLDKMKGLGVYDLYEELNEDAQMYIVTSADMGLDSTDTIQIVGINSPDQSEIPEFNILGITCGTYITDASKIIDRKCTDTTAFDPNKSETGRQGDITVNNIECMIIATHNVKYTVVDTIVFGNKEYVEAMIKNS